MSTLTACPSNGDGDGDGDGDGTETGTESESGSETGSASGTGDGDGDAGDGDGDAGDGDGDSGDGDACQAACEVEATCGNEVTLQECLQFCAQGLTELSPECMAIYDDFLTCLGALSCEEYEDYMNEPTPDYPCNQEEAALDQCDPGTDEPGDPTSGDAPAPMP